MTQARERAIDRVRNMVLAALAGRQARIYLFGSCARGDAVNSSDIDVAIDSLDPLPASLVADLVDSLEDSTIPFDVEIVDLRHADPALRRRVLSEGIAWTP
jgi:predicted nucleotidyltransferase